MRALKLASGAECSSRQTKRRLDSIHQVVKWRFAFVTVDVAHGSIRIQGCRMRTDLHPRSNFERVGRFKYHLDCSSFEQIMTITRPSARQAAPALTLLVLSPVIVELLFGSTHLTIITALI